MIYNVCHKPCLTIIGTYDSPDDEPDPNLLTMIRASRFTFLDGQQFIPGFSRLMCLRCRVSINGREDVQLVPKGTL
jgi:hypothetical protein